MLRDSSRSSFCCALQRPDETLDMDSYRSLFEHIPSGIIIGDEEGRILDANPAALLLLNEDLDRLRGTHVNSHAFLKEIGAANGYQNCLERRVLLFDEGGFRKADGEIIYFQYHLVPVAEQSGVSHIHLVMDEVTARVKAEEVLMRTSNYFDRIFASISPLATLTPNLTIRLVNEPFLFEFQVPVHQVVLGTPLLDLLDLGKGDRDDFLANVEESHKRPVQNCEFRRGQEIYGYSVFRFEDNIAIILKNITAIKKLERKVLSLHSRLLQVQEEERQRIASELHDSVGQTILGAKMNFQYHDQNPEDSSRFQIGLELIDRASQELREIYTNLYPSTLRELGLESAVREFTGNFLEMSGCRAELLFELERPLARDLETNLFRIIQEIFTNIFKHAGAERVELHLRAEGARVILTVQDDGHGFRMEEARLTGGFGLTNMQRRVEDFAGEISIESTPGEGSRITISLPSDYREGLDTQEQP